LQSAQPARQCATAFFEVSFRNALHPVIDIFIGAEVADQSMLRGWISREEFAQAVLRCSTPGQLAGIRG